MLKFLLFVVLVALSAFGPWGWSRYFVAAALLVFWAVEWGTDGTVAEAVREINERLDDLTSRIAELEESDADDGSDH